MINFSNQVPSVYPKTSRDFQYLCWLFNIVLNAVKHNVDALYNLPNVTADSKLTELLALTLGFRVKRNYDQKQLTALVSILPSILKCKGTEKAITLVGNALIKVSGSEGGFKCTVNGTCLEVTIPKDLVDITLLMDLLPYILPAGMTCRLIRQDQIPRSYTTEVDYSDFVWSSKQYDLVWDNYDHTNEKAVGASVLFELPEEDSSYKAKAEFSVHKTDAEGNYITEKYDNNFGEEVDTGNYVLNTGLLDNTVIPVLDNDL